MNILGSVILADFLILRIVFVYWLKTYKRFGFQRNIDEKLRLESFIRSHIKKARLKSRF